MARPASDADDGVFSWWGGGKTEKCLHKSTTTTIIIISKKKNNVINYQFLISFSFSCLIFLWHSDVDLDQNKCTVFFDFFSKIWHTHSCKSCTAYPGRARSWRSKGLIHNRRRGCIWRKERDIRGHWARCGDSRALRRRTVDYFPVLLGRLLVLGLGDWGVLWGEEQALKKVRHTG